MTTTWAHLPNAAHIDRVFASSKANPDEWANAYNSIKKSDTYWEVRLEAWLSVVDAVRDAVMNTIRITAEDALWDTIIALVAYDDCAYMLDSDPGELAIVAAFGDRRAILLLPACIALSKEKSK